MPGRAVGGFKQRAVHLCQHMRGKKLGKGQV